MSRVEALIRDLSHDGVQIHIWSTKGGDFQANVKERAGSGWTAVTRDDPIEALAEALRQRVGGVATREVIGDPELAHQIDLEDAILAAGQGVKAVSVDAFEDVLG